MKPVSMKGKVLIRITLSFFLKKKAIYLVNMCSMVEVRRASWKSREAQSKSQLYITNVKGGEVWL